MVHSENIASELHSPKFFTTQSTSPSKSRVQLLGKKVGFLTCVEDHGETVVVHCGNCNRNKTMRRTSWNTCTGTGRACGCRRGGQARKYGARKVKSLEESLKTFRFDKLELEQIERIVRHCVNRLQMTSEAALTEARTTVYTDREDYQRIRFEESPLKGDTEFRYQPRLACHGGEVGLY